VEDLNTGNSTGVKQGTGNLDSQLRRSSAFDSYYQQAKGRPNLDVLHDATVEKIIFSTTRNNGNGTKRASAVQFTDHLSGEFFVVEASKEIILAGGAFASPQMLMVSVCSLPPLSHQQSRTDSSRESDQVSPSNDSASTQSTSMRTSDSSTYTSLSTHQHHH
jgi:choline dehydrogenase-like flavoprotein